jgi:hypothetical protein
MKTLKDQIYALAKEITNLAYQVEELELDLQNHKDLHARQSKVITYAIGQLGMTFNDMLEAASIQETEALAELEDTMPTAAEMQELSAQDSEQLTDEQKWWYYTSSTQSIDPENC